jgi:hypothetical protein
LYNLKTETAIKNVKNQPTKLMKNIKDKIRRGWWWVKKASCMLHEESLFLFISHKESTDLRFYDYPLIQTEG